MVVRVGRSERRPQPEVVLVLLRGDFGEGLGIDSVESLLPLKALVAAGGEVGKEVDSVARTRVLVVGAAKNRIPVTVIPSSFLLIGQYFKSLLKFLENGL